VPLALNPATNDALLLVEFAFKKTQGAIKAAVAMPERVTEAVAAPSVIVPAALAPVRLFSRYPVSFVSTPEVGVPKSGVVKAMLVAVVPLGSASTPVVLALIVALPLVEPLITTLPPVPLFAPSAMLLLPVIAPIT